VATLRRTSGNVGPVPIPHEDLESVADPILNDQAEHPGDHYCQETGQKEIPGQAPPPGKKAPNHDDSERPHGGETVQADEMGPQATREGVDQAEELLLEERRMAGMERRGGDDQNCGDQAVPVGGPALSVGVGHRGGRATDLPHRVPCCVGGHASGVNHPLPPDGSRPRS
jgi:hypothetical protein